jgi:hypothetical protein
MFTGATVLVTIVSALGLGILAGWAVLAGMLHLFFASKQADEDKLAPQRAMASAAASAAAGHTS